MSERGQTCSWCKDEFWSGKKGIISPIDHRWFCCPQHYHHWWIEDKRKQRYIANQEKNRKSDLLPNA